LEKVVDLEGRQGRRRQDGDDLALHLVPHGLLESLQALAYRCKVLPAIAIADSPVTTSS